MKYRPEDVLTLTEPSEPWSGQWQVGSLTGAVASKRVTEAREGIVTGKPAEECKGIRELDCETNKSSRDESRA